MYSLRRHACIDCQGPLFFLKGVGFSLSSIGMSWIPEALGSDFAILNVGRRKNNPKGFLLNSINRKLIILELKRQVHELDPLF